MTTVPALLRSAASAHDIPPDIALLLPPNAIVADAFAFARQNPTSPMAAWCMAIFVSNAPISLSAASSAASSSSMVPSVPADLIAEWATPKNIAIAHIEAWRDAQVSPDERAERVRVSAQMLLQLDDNGHISGDLSLGEYTALTTLPEGLHVRGNLSLNNCTALTALPAGLHVGGDLFLIRCTALTALPAGLHVGGELSLFGCTAITALPEGLHVGGNLDLSLCTALIALPAGLHVGGELSLFGCTAITALPEGLRVGGNLILNNCTAITALPAGLHVGRNLSLFGCTAITALPEGLRVEGNLIFNNCTALTALPAWLIALRHTADGHVRTITLSGIPLPDPVIEALQAINAQNVGVNFILAAAQHADRPQLTLRIDRNGNILEQAFAAYADKPPADFRIPPYVIFNGEMGIDAGGVGKDFMNSVLRSLFHPENNLFAAHEDDRSQLQPGETRNHLTDDMRAKLRLGGRLLAMAHVSGLPSPELLSDGVFASTALLGHDLGQTENEILIALLETFEPQEAKLLRTFGQDPDGLFGLNFTINLADGTTVELKENGITTDVTAANANEYIRLRTLYKLQGYMNHLALFWGGVEEVLGTERYQALIQSPNVREKLCGKSVIDVHDWQAHTDFAIRPASVTQDQAEHAKTIFFAAVSQLAQQEQSKLLEFSTGYTRPPIDGFQGLCVRNQPRQFSLSVGYDPIRIPEAHTCFNQLDIPRCMTDREIDAAIAKAGAEPPAWATMSTYDEKRTAFMLERLRIAIAGDGSFGLS